MLATVTDLLVKAVGFIGGAIAVFGAIQLGLGIKDGAQGGGQIAAGLAMIAGGGIIAAAAILFGTLDTSWAN
mgnify:CR=1 FL=1